jgi:hypothetical protein
MKTLKLKPSPPDPLRHRAAQTLLAGAIRASDTGSTTLSMMEIQAEVHAVRSCTQVLRLTR